MDYEKAYKGAIERAKAEQETFIKGGNISGKSAIERIFPELYVNEDERIKNEIIAFVEQSIHRGGGTPIPQEQENKWIAWLEKQDEQKHTDKVESKFKVGDWITNGGLLVGQVTSFDGEYYHYMCEGIEQPLHISNVYNWHLWTIQDAKDGDVLSDEKPFIFRGFGDSEHPNNPTAYCGINSSGTFILSTENEWWTADDFYPATEEQRDLLFKKMKDAGYEWDDEKKELKKIEPKFKVGDCVVYNRNDSSREILYVYNIRDGGYYFNDNIHLSWSVKECDEKCHLWTIQDAKNGDVLAEHETIVMFEKIEDQNIRCYCTYHYLGFNPAFYVDTLQNKNPYRPATKEQRDLLFQQIKDAGYKWDDGKRELKKLEQASAWSEEDEERIEFLIAMCDDEQAECVNNSTIYRECTETKDWLKSLKDRVQPQLRQEWSKDDKEMIRHIRCYLNEYGNWLSDKNEEKSKSIYKACDWLKSINPKHWKPSEQNIKDLELCTDLVKDKMGVGFHRLQVFIDELKSL